LEKILEGEPDISVGDSQLEMLGKQFEERINEAKEMILAWTGTG
jgi:hypothetical protein